MIVKFMKDFYIQIIDNYIFILKKKNIIFLGFGFIFK